MKPDSDITYLMAKIELKPWKGKPDIITFVIRDKEDVLERTNKILDQIIKKGQHKRRTVLGVTLTYPLLKKL